MTARCYIGAGQGDESEKTYPSRWPVPSRSADNGPCAWTAGCESGAPTPRAPGRVAFISLHALRLMNVVASVQYHLREVAHMAAK